MTKRVPEAHDRAVEQSEPRGTESENGGTASGAAGARRPYQRPSVVKRRSVRQATLVSGTGSSSVGSSASP
jgi:hypothetical protein